MVSTGRCVRPVVTSSLGVMHKKLCTTYPQKKGTCTNMYLLANISAFGYNMADKYDRQGVDRYMLAVNGDGEKGFSSNMGPP